MEKIAFALIVLIFAVGCGSTRTAIRTEPSGTTIKVGEKEKVIGTTPMYYDFDKELGYGQALGLGTSELLIKFILEGYEDEVKTIQKGGGSLFESPRWPSDIFIRLRKKE